MFHPQTFLSSSSCPEIHGYLHAKEHGRKSWKKFYFVLRRSGLYFSNKGTSKVGWNLHAKPGDFQRLLGIWVQLDGGNFPSSDLNTTESAGISFNHSQYHLLLLIRSLKGELHRLSKCVLSCQIIRNITEPSVYKGWLEFCRHLFWDGMVRSDGTASWGLAQ